MSKSDLPVDWMNALITKSSAYDKITPTNILKAKVPKGKKGKGSANNTNNNNNKNNNNSKKNKNKNNNKQRSLEDSTSSSSSTPSSSSTTSLPITKASNDKPTTEPIQEGEEPDEINSLMNECSTELKTRTSETIKAAGHHEQKKKKQNDVKKEKAPKPEKLGFEIVATKDFDPYANSSYGYNSEEENGADSTLEDDKEQQLTKKQKNKQPATNSLRDRKSVV